MQPWLPWGSLYRDQAGLEPTASASRALGMKGMHPPAQLSSLLLMVELESTL